MPNNYVSLIDVKGDVYSVKDISIHNTLGVANGIATLDETGKVPNEQLSIATQTNDGLMTKEDKELLNNIPKQIITDNLLPYPYNETTHTQYGVTWTDNGDGTIIANGTNTETSKTSQFYFNADTPLDLKPNTAYTLSGCPSGGATSTYRIRIIINYQKDGQAQYSDIGNGVTFTTPSNYQHCRIMIDISSGVTVNNLIFKPMLEIGTVAHPYQSYNLSRQKLREDINNMGSGGSDVTVTPTLTRGTKIGTITVDGEAKELYAPIETYVKQTFTALNENYNILLSYNKKNNRDETNPVRKAYDFTANPGTGALFAMGYDRNDITGKTIDVNNFTLSLGNPHCVKYIEKTDGGSANITNIPVTGKAFLLDVDLIRWASTTDYITRQIFTSLGDAYVEYIRYCNKGTWGDWSRRLFTDNSISVVNNLTSTSETAALSANQGNVLNERVNKLLQHQYSLIRNTDIGELTNEQKTFTLFNERKFSDYGTISVTIGASSTDIRATCEISRVLFTGLDGGAAPRTIYLDCWTDNGTVFNQVCIEYVSDTQVKAYLVTANTKTKFLNIYGTKVDDVAF